SASSRFQPYQIRSAFPLSVSGPCWSGVTVRLSLFGLSDSIRSDFRSVAGPNSFPMIVGGVCLSAVPTLSEAFCRSEIGERFPDKDSEVLRGIDVPTEADERLTVALEHV
ncbi:hypothetical protein, partial [Streptomyces chrestomyceticus]|uniref:hypothetical protein n=1 Tax=Streptomyces chrestomyceticus TaxID=68185 RepID=UPI0019CF54A8